QYRTARTLGVSRGAHPEAAVIPNDGRGAGGGHLRAPPGARGVRGLDDGTEEHTVRRVLSRGGARLPPIRSRAAPQRLRDRARFLRDGPAVEVGDGDAAGGTARDLLVAARPAG